MKTSTENFINDCIYLDNGNELTKVEMYSAYVDYCNTNNLGACTMKMFGTRIPKFIPYLMDGTMNTTKDGKAVRVRGWRNVAIKA